MNKQTIENILNCLQGKSSGFSNKDVEDVCQFALKAIEALEKIEDLQPVNERERRAIARECLELIGEEK